MPSITIPTPPLEALQRFCSKHTVHPTALLKLGWALILQSYFDTGVFLLDEKNEDPKGEQDVRILVSFLPELASKSPAIVTLQRDGTQQQPEQDTVLLYSSTKDFDSSLQKVWSRLRILWNGCGTQDDGEKTVQGDREVGRFMDTSETPGPNTLTRNSLMLKCLYNGTIPD